MEQRQSSEESLVTRIGQAVILLHGGDREEARNRMGDLWSELGDTGDPVQRCTLAHYMADTQDDPGDELAWDLRALTAADGEAPEVVAFHPAFHANLAADYVKLHRPDAARLHLERARACAHVLGDDGYGDGVRTVIARLTRQLAPG
ncbi:hypothetical protein [Streptomyces sp. 8L]|uniref:hypothetical protein n=1 Tax=unclassified Streptomyces TaxID=2593676 RepID=UPI001CD70174|nr:hypothetical protein [Streptomyces sp. 8L]MCA1221860.1 hypothetical protein [Streptomyces sp. 8L]